MEHYKLLFTFHNKPEDENYSQHLLDGDKGKVYSCFRCERCRREYNIAQHYNLEKNIDGTNMNSQEVVAAKFKDLKEEISGLKYGAHVGGSNDTM